MGDSQQSKQPAIHRSIVLDTAAFIAGTDSLYSLGGVIDGDTNEYISSNTTNDTVTYYTTPDVINEVRDVRARARLLLLSDILQVRAPSSEALAAVILFARGTGDYSALSLTDLRVMALCWMLEMERDGGKSLKKEPEKKSYTQIRCGQLIPLHEVEKREREEKEQREKELEQSDGWTTVKSTNLRNIQNRNSKKSKTKSKSKKKKKSNQLTIDSESDMQVEDNINNQVDDKNHDVKQINDTQSKTTENTSNEKSISEITKTVQSLELTSTSTNQQELSTNGNEYDENEGTVDSHIELVPIKDDLEVERIQVTEDDNGNDSDDGKGWINVNNLEEHLQHDAMLSIPTEEDEARTGCVTTDFAMQNTMIQMGLKILTVDGRRTIKKIKHFAIRCSGCGTITRELNVKFCDACGNFQTLHRVAFTVSKSGIARAFLNPKKMRPSLRGTKYNIPTQKGGRNPTDLILRADQIDMVKQRRIEKQLERQNVDVLDPTTFYNAGVKFNPRNSKPLVAGYGRRNPNEVKSLGMKKKR